MSKIEKLPATDDSTLLKHKLLRQLLEEEGIEAQKGQAIPAEPRSGDDLLPLSFAQQRLWFLDRLEPNSLHYNIPFMLRLIGALDIALLARCFNTILMRHESLRTTFHEIDGRPVQLISSEARVNLEIEDLSSVPSDEREARVKAIADEEAARPFDLSQGPLWRVRLIRRESKVHILLLTMHHIVSDGWSMGVFMQETAALYEDFSEGRPSPLDDLPIQYADYAMWQRERLSGDVLDRELAYWRKQLSGAPLALDLPTDYPRPAVQRHRGACRSVLIARSVGEELAAISRRENATLFMTLLAAFNALLRRYTGEHDITIGSPIAGRTSPETEGLIGFFVNTLVMRVDLPGDSTFLELVRRVRETAVSAYAHQEAPFEKLLEELAPDRDLSRHPLFQVAFVMQNTPFPALRLPGVRIEPMEIENHTAKFDLTISIEEAEDGLKAYLEYDTDLFADSTIIRLLTHFEILLRGIVENPQRRISELPLLSEAERRLLLAPKNVSRRNPQSDAGACLHRSFEAQAARTPDAVALVFEEEMVTYDVLNRRANQTAHYLRRFGVGPETPVGLMMERSSEGWGDMIVGLIGILKAGGAYVPLDPTYPHERLAFMLEDTHAPVLLTQRKFADRLSERGVQKIYMDADWESIAAESRDNPLVPMPPKNPAYVIYTSGSTGKPKGVVVSHSNVTRLFTATQPWFHFENQQGRQDVWTLFHSYAFDFSVWEIWGALLYGGKLVVVPYWISRTPELLYDLLVEEQVTVLNQTPSAFRQLIRIDSATAQSQITALRYVIFGGEALDLKSLGSWFDRHHDTQPQLINMYGITETCVHVTYRPLTADDLAGGSVVGEPIPDLSVYALDQHLQPVPIGVSGELYVSGQGLSRGYLNRPELTAERFIPNPFGLEPGERLYCTGDKARFLTRGDIEYLGRLDYQVKIRGFRIELQEIEAVIKSHAGARECAVIVREDAPDDKRLVAYVVADHNAAPTRDELRLFARERLPDYMAPSLFVFQDELPLTAQGKIDRRALLQLDYRRDSLTADTFVAPRNEVETMLAEIWAEALGVGRVGIDDNYFALGGDSIRSIQVRAMATERGLKFSLQQLFQYQTIRELSLVCETIKSETSTTPPFSLISAEDRARLAADTTDIEDAYPLSHAQAGLVFHSEYSRDYIVYLSSFHIRAPFDAEKLRESLQYVGDRHAIMRTSYNLTDFNEPLQLVHRKTSIPLTVEDTRHLPDEEMEARLSSWMETEMRNRFDWTTPPLFRFHVHLRKDDEFQFTMTEPTLDGWSVASLVTELFERYFAVLEDGPLSPEPPLRSSYADFIRLERNALADTECRDYWKEKLRDAAGSRLPRHAGADRGDTVHQVERIDVTLRPAVSNRLWKLARELEVPLKSLLLAAHLMAVSFWSGKSDVFTGLFSNGRPEEADGERVLGIFLNVLPFHFQLGRESWEDLARAVFDAERETLPFRRYPIQELHRIYQAENLFDTAFNYTHFHVYRRLQSVEGLAGLSHFGTEQTYYALTAQFNVDEETSEIFLGLDYREQELSRDQVEAIAETYLTVLDAIVQDSRAHHESLCLLPEPELRRLLVEFNGADLEYPLGVGIDGLHQLFERQVEQTPDAVALVCGTERLTFGELNIRANRLGRYLQKLGVGPETYVCLCLERSVEMIAVLLGILKAGGAYVPLDPTYPRERLRFTLEDVDAGVLITRHSLRAVLPETKCPVIYLDAEEELIARESAENLEGGVRRENVAYVIYTSGSTGKAKGVAITHGNALCLLHWAGRVFSRERLAGVLASTSLCFDLSVFEIFAPLSWGGAVIVAENTLQLPNLPAASEVTLINTVPSAISELVGQTSVCPSVPPIVNLAGEALSQKLAQQIYALPQVDQVWNLYGPSEDTTYTTGEIVRRGAEVTIGRPIFNKRVHILDQQLSLVPLGVSGALYICGDGVSRGYINRPELTAERFIPNPFGQTSGERMYVTGDLARYLPDGRIEFLGRVDNQVKLRGHRIELGEIEAALNEHEVVKESIVVLGEDSRGEKSLVAFLTSSDGRRPTGAELRSYLHDRLPKFMIPSAFVLLDEMPLTAVGKIDRKALSGSYQLERAEGADLIVSPRTPVEEALCGMWAQVFRFEHVSVKSDFFDLGGHSLLATRLASRIRDALHIEVSVRDLFENPTVEALGRRIERSLREGQGIDPVQFAAEARPELIPLSFAQQRLWFLDQLEPGSSFYNIPLTLRLSGPLNIQALERSVNEIIRRHETLRTSFHAVKQPGQSGQHWGAPAQFISDAAPMTVPIIDISHLPAWEREVEAERQASEEARRPFDLTAGPLIRVVLLRLDQNSHALLITMHHIISDGWSVGILLSEMTTLYRAFSSEKYREWGIRVEEVTHRSQLPTPDSPFPIPHSPLPIQYADFAIWQRRWLSGERLDRQLDYWKRQLEGAPSTLDLPTDRPYPPVRTFRGAKYHFLLSEALLEEIKAVNRSHGVTLFMTLLAAFKTLLYRYTGQSDIVIGSPIAGRNLREVENLIGFFVNTLVLRSDLGGAPRFSDLLGRVRETALGAYAHQDLPFEKLVEELQPERDLSHTPLFQVMFALENMALRSVESAGVQIDLMGIDSGGAKFDLTVLASESRDGIDCVYEYNTDIFEEGTVARCASHFRMLLEAVVKHPQQRISDIPLLTESERDQLLIDWNETYVGLPPSLEGKCIHVLFEEQAALTPDAIAVVSGSEQLTYGSLNERAGELARYLQDLGMATDAPIGLCTGNSLEMLIGIMGILKAGGSYLPLDPSYPHERLAFMLRDAGTTTLLTWDRLQSVRGMNWGVQTEVCPTPGLRIVCLDTSATEPQRHRERETERKSGAAATSSPHSFVPASLWLCGSVANLQNPAYVIYTSGSTGTPKGVVVTHSNLAHSTHARVSYYREPVGRYLLLSSVAFDSSVAGIFWTLTTGGALVLPPEGSTADAEIQAALIASHGVTHLLALPALYRLILENARPNQLSSLRVAITAGEACTEEIVNRHRAAAPQSLLFNEYGPSEATVWSSVYDCSSGPHLPRVPIGRPIANTQIYILDANLQPVPVGVSGEIYIGGSGVTNGYLNRPDLTAERFIPSGTDFSLSAQTHAMDRLKSFPLLYKTGDVGRYLADGNIEFIGRADHQIKLRGFRIELGEIEAVLKRHDAVREAVVSVREDVTGLKRLVGYVVCDEATDLQAVDLMAYLKERLPNYMVPSACVLLEALPLAPNGKPDRNALPPPEQPRSEMGERFVAPRTRVETIIAGIWAKTLGVERISVNDNFFELGGHSLLAVQMVYQARESLRVELPMRTLFEAPTVADFAREIERLLEIGMTQSGTDFSLSAPIQATDRLKPVPLSFAQERLWFLNQLEPGNPFYNIPAALRLRGRLRDELLKETLERLIARHESLRTGFRVIGDRPRQIIDRHSEVPWSFVDLSGRPDAEAIVGPLASKEARHAFALDHPPLLRVVLYRMGDDDHVLLMNMHHIISDAQSVAILTREIGAIYEALMEGALPELPDLRVQYLDYAVWQRKWLEGENLERELSYWRAKLAGVPASLELPADRPRPATQSHRGANYRWRLDADLSDRIKQLGRGEGATLFMTLLAAWQLLLARYSGQEDLLVGTPIANRTRAELEGVIGFFTNTLALRANLAAAPTCREFLSEARRTALEAYAHQDLPFERLVEELRPERDLSRAPLFQVMFLLRDTPPSEPQMADLEVEELDLPMETAKFDLTLATAETSAGIEANIEYCADLFDRETIERMAGHYTRLLENVAADPDERVWDVELLSEIETRQIVEEWNHINWAGGAAPGLDGARPLPLPVPYQFERVAAETPDAVAVIYRSEHLSYAELKNQSDLLAQYLGSRGVGAESRIGLCLNRGVAHVIAILGILKAGAAYVPLDPDYPAERLRFMATDAGVDLLVTEPGLESNFSVLHIPISVLPTERSGMGNGEWGMGNWEKTPTPHSTENLVYVIYTSGSTGRPKGVAMTHGAIANLIEWLGNTLRARARTAQFSSIGFDVCFEELFCALSSGGTIVIVPPEERRDVSRLAELLRDEGVERVILPAAIIEPLVAETARFVDEGRLGLKELISTAEQMRLKSEAWEWLSEKGCWIWNHYGPTETHVVTAYELSDKDSDRAHHPPIGRPITGCRAYVFDRGLRPAPIGVLGEIYLGGKGVGRGYPNSPEQTAERFIPDPFGGEAGARLYRTGDLGRYLPDGAIEYFGRTDHQVKIRGFRVELGEIEAILKEHESVRDAAVSVSENISGVKRLTAYTVLQSGARLDTPALRRFLKQRLPDYMIPSDFITLDALPLNTNGKLDRRRLPGCKTVTAMSAIPQTTIEQITANVLAEALGLHQVGIHDNFFELGGHSLLATQVVSRLRSVLGVELAVRALFEAPTVAGLAAEVEVALGTRQASPIPPLQPCDRDGLLPLSFAQERLWFLNQLEPDNPFYNMPTALRLRGPIREDLLKQILSYLIARHESLRTSFGMAGGRPVQIIHPVVEIPWRFIDLSDQPDAEAIAAQQACQEAQRPFDLERAPLLRVALYRIREIDHVLLLNMHHIVGDAWSNSVLVREFGACYQAFADEVSPELPDLSMQYADYAVWQRQWLEGEVLERQLGYWRAMLAGVPTSLELPADRPRPVAQSHRGANYRWRLDADLSDRIKRLGRGEGATLFMTLLAAWQLLLARYSGQEDLLVGTPIANRTRAELEGVIGFFTNTLALRAKLAAAPAFREFLSEARRTALEAYAHQDLPFERLVEELRPERDLSRAPLFQVMFLLENTPAQELQIAGLEIEEMELSTSVAKFDLILAMAETPAGIAANVEYNTDLFDRERIERMANHLTLLLEGVASDPDRRVSEIPLLSMAEITQILEEWGGAEPQFDKRCVHELFERQAELAPDAVAVIYGEQWVTYRELNARANQLAHRLRCEGIGPDAPVGLLMERSIEMVIALLGAVKAGGAYVPIDTEYPPERIDFIMKDVRAPLLITQERFVEGLPAGAAALVCLDTDWEEIAGRNSGNLAAPISPDNLAYISYTSGSTGLPKGIAVPHRSLIGFMVNADYVRFDSSIRSLQHSSISWDALTLELWPALIHGGCCILYPGRVPAPSELERIIKDYDVNTLWITSSLFNALMDTLPEALSGVGQVMTGGEALSEVHVRRALKLMPETHLVNGYGPSECVVFTCCYPIPKDLDEHARAIPIGKPIGDRLVYVLDRWMTLAQAEAEGELYVGGDSLARGYLGRPELTAERFVPHPYNGRTGERLYRTGDVVRRRADGLIEFVGRTDDQVKVRGYRIELGEINAAIRRHPAVRECVVLVERESTLEKRLVAYIAVNPGHDISAADLRSYLKQRIPEYMIPAGFVLLPELPLKSTGKIDRQVLSTIKPAENESSGEFVRPRTAIEEVIAGIWAEVLRTAHFGVHDNFFELGGHSLLAVHLVSRVREVTQVSLPVRCVFEAPTVAGMASRIYALTDNVGIRQFVARKGLGSSSLAAIQPNGSRPPFFCVHPADGNVFCYVALSRMLGSDQPFYGLQSPGLDDDEEPYTEIEAAAVGYITALRSVQPKGPYRLGGWSMGGVIAFEMARQFLECGEQVSRLILIDSFLSARSEAIIQETDQSLLAGFALNLGLSIDQLAAVQEELRLLGPDEQLNRIVEMARESGLAPPDINVSTIRKLRYVYDANVRAVNKYAPQTVPVQVTLLKASEPLSTDTESQVLEWERWAASGVKVYDAPGNHFDMLREPNLKFLAKTLNDCLADRESLTTGQ